MVKKLKQIALFTYYALFFMACSKDGDISPISVEGKWELQNISSNVEYQKDTPDIKSEDVSNKGLFFDFAADGFYTTNGAIELGNIRENGGKISSGKYEFSKGVLSLNYIDPDFRIPVTLYLKSKLSGSDLKLSLEKKELVKAFAEATNVDDTTKILIEYILGSIVKFDYSMTLKK
jgi:hypothetical protein